MSRIGKNPVTIPQGVDVSIAGSVLTAKGKVGTIKIDLSGEVTTTVEQGKVWVKPRSDTKRARTHWGTQRAIINNVVQGVAKGYSKSLEINGVGYRAAVQGKTLTLQLGYSHDVQFPIPDDVKIVCDKPTSIQISGASKHRVGQVAAVIRGFRRPEPYKGKGIKYETETIRRKEGKKK